MSNMGYCRFENTYLDLDDCFEHIEDDDLSENEQAYRKQLISLCKTIVDETETL